jgi:hypothetical protein
MAPVPQLITNEIDEQSSPESADESSNRSELFGRYVGQINARIDRAWLRPRSPIGATLFSCRALIDQDERGNVAGVILEDCNGDGRWQLSLVRAIQSASPLPAPPDPKVFRHQVQLSFQSTGFRAGIAEDGFEPSTVQVAGPANTP